MRPRPLWLRLLPTSVVVNLATLGPLGRVRKAPGTVGSVAGLVWFTLFFFYAPSITYVVLGGISIVIAILFCGEAEVRLKKVDPGEIILDEFVAIPFCFIGLQPYLWEGRAWLIVILGFLFFRLFDIVKPFGIKRLQSMHGGLGVVLDDLAAAFATALCLHLLANFTTLFH
jgi:phosphatidylglycerophosphatase A